MLSLAKKHLQQHAQMASDAQSQAARTQLQARKKPAREELLAGFPLAMPSAKKAGKKSGVASTARGVTFEKKEARRAARVGVSASALKRSKALQKKMPRPTLLEQAERSLSTTVSAAETTRRNLSMLTHTSDRKKKTHAAMRKILLATTLPSRHAKQEESEEDDEERDDYVDDDEIADLMD